MVKKLLRHFREVHFMVIGGRTASRLARTVPMMRGIDPAVRMAVTGVDASALLPRRVDVTLGELSAVLQSRRVA